jgi:hypothetical protein
MLNKTLLLNQERLFMAELQTLEEYKAILNSKP